MVTLAGAVNAGAVLLADSDCLHFVLQQLSAAVNQTHVLAIVKPPWQTSDRYWSSVNECCIRSR
jgi:hypothetical protein